ncbi:hypothetical protein MSAN_01371400 [Mycena sanguinolenta]|uniref:Uncharacterized protein n=1 Tax=Mycena sanguinolenta TaxID=230812 RepID=A0A8H7D060_9AGAR|nr:hypothetical protein MSAN_01371400 [Mycena sanguinolenta]
MRRPEQPGPQNYIPKSSSAIEFHFKWKTFRVNAQNVAEFEDFPFHLELQQDRYSVRFLEFRSFCDPPSDIGNPGDIWLNISPSSYALFALNVKKEWIRWPGPTLDKKRMIPHPYLPIYALWCTIKQASWYHCDKLGRDWSGEKLIARQELGGYPRVENMLDPSAGIRLILLGEETEQNKRTPTTMPSIDDQLKSALSGLASSSELPNVQEALVATLSSGIDYLLIDRKKLLNDLSEAQKRAALAEQKLARFNILDNNHYRAHCYGVGLQTDGDMTSSRTSALNIMTSKHLDILFSPAEEGRSKNCLICLALITYNPKEETYALMLHALEAHPNECSVFASVPNDQLEVYRREFG